ncbi:hypothetical protein D3C72_2587080 [compost metagenome]
MFLNRFAGRLRVTCNDGIVDGAMLRQEHVGDAGVIVNKTAVVKNPIFEQLIAGA